MFTTIARGVEDRRDLPGDLLDVAEVGRAVVALRCLHAEEHDLGAAGGGGRADDEREPLRREALGDERGQAVLEDRDLALAQARDPLGVDVGAHDLVTEVRQARRGREADVAGPDDGDAHAAPTSSSHTNDSARIGPR